MEKVFKFLFLVVVFEAGAVFGMYLVLKSPAPAWRCNAEDEVVVIDNTCKHIDTL